MSGYRRRPALSAAIDGPAAAWFWRILRQHRGRVPAQYAAQINVALDRLQVAAEEWADAQTADAEPLPDVEDSEAWLSADEAAAVLGLSPRTIRRMCEDGRLAGRFHAGRWLIDSGAVHARTLGQPPTAA